MHRHTPLLIIGAGPFGLAMAAYAHQRGIEHVVVGQPMAFWQAHMPLGMYLRSACDWHLDPFKVATIERYLTTRRLTPAEVEPLSRAFYLDYARWFQGQKQIVSLPLCVERLRYDHRSTGRFVATLEDGQTIGADNVLLAVGYAYFKYVPAELTAVLPRGRFAHTCDLVQFDALAGKRCLIVGGRQSAFEWAALLHEQGAADIHIVHRHATPVFAASDWSWVLPLMDEMVAHPGWYRRLAPAAQDELTSRLWAEGRLKLEPWLGPRIAHETIHLWPHAQVVGCAASARGALAVQLDSGAALTVDQVILATGYQVDMAHVPFLAGSAILSDLATRNGFPVLDEHFQTTIPGLFATSMMATHDFGLFLAFTVAARSAALIIGGAVERRLRGSSRRRDRGPALPTSPGDGPVYGRGNHVSPSGTAKKGQCASRGAH